MTNKAHLSFFVDKDDHYLIYCARCNAFHTWHNYKPYWGDTPVGAVKCPYCQLWSKAVECTEKDGEYQSVVSLEEFERGSAIISYFDKIIR